jgi:Kef-type K+ transport system membrane component KefB
VTFPEGDPSLRECGCAPTSDQSLALHAAIIAWAVALAAVGEALGLSKEVGAFVAGASLASKPYREAIGSRLVTVRDFLLLFFFIDLGARLDLSLLGATLGQAILFSAFVLIGNPIIVLIIMGATESLQRARGVRAAS